MIVEISTDGSTSPNPGRGGWACVFRVPHSAKAMYGFSPYGTNNRMELLAVIKALEHLKVGCEIILYSDSKYVIEGITKFLPVWKTNGWRTGSIGCYSGQHVKNQGLWEQLDKATQRHAITWKYVKGHATHADNNICDKLAAKARKEQSAGFIDLNKFGLL